MVRKKLLSVLCLIIVILMMGSFSITEKYSVTEKGRVVYSEKITFTEDEFIELGKSEQGIGNLIGFSFNKEKINGENYYTYEYTDSAHTFGYLNSNIFGESYQPFQCGSFTATEFWGNYTNTSGNKISGIKANREISFKFQNKVNKTNGNKIDDYTVSFNFGSTKDLYYATTEGSNADWTKADDVKEAAKKLASTYVVKPVVKIKLINKTTAKIYWNKNVNADKYDIYRCANYGYDKLIKTQKGNTYIQKNLKKGSRYYFYVVGKNDMWTSDFSDEKSIAILYGATTIKNASVSDKNLTLNISKKTFATGYIIYRSTKKNGTYKKVTTVTSNKYTQQKLKSGTYYYKVKAFQKAGNYKNYANLSNAKKVVVKN